MTSAPAQFDPAAFKTQQRLVWDYSAKGWSAWRDQIEAWFAPVTKKMIDLAPVKPGQTVLDAGTGYGQPALTAAGIVGPDGHVFGIDLSRAMLEAARKQASKQNLSNVSFAERDIEALDDVGRFDVVLSRLGLMFVVDRARAFGAIRNALKPGGVLVAAVWGPSPSHHVSLALGPLVSRLGLPPPPQGAPSPFSMSDASQLTSDLKAAGFVDVLTTEMTVLFRFRSVEEFVRFNQENLPPEIMQAVRKIFGAEDASDAWRLVSEAVQPHLTPNGAVELSCIILCVRAVAPSAISVLRSAS